MNLKNLLASLLLTAGVGAFVLPPVNTSSGPDCCFPALGFTAPPLIPLDLDMQGWWCDPATEYGFLGFSYEVSACALFILTSRLPS
jgi:hypothetical protein